MAISKGVQLPSLAVPLQQWRRQEKATGKWRTADRTVGCNANFDADKTL